MQTIMLDGSLYATPRDLHLALKMLLSLPEYYGLNADALNDCLSGMRRPANLWILDPGQNETAAAMETVRAVFLDNGGTVKELY